MRLMTSLAALAALAMPAIALADDHAQEAETAEAAPACDEPVVMVVSGTLYDIERIVAYARAIADSGIYPKLGGYYMNETRPLAHFEGEAPEGHSMLLVRFPCLANAEAFWYARVYQEDIIPLRQNPSAGDFLVRVYAERDLREDMIGKVTVSEYTADFSEHGVEQVEQAGE